MPAKLQLPQVTLCAASDVALEATIRALEISLENIDFHHALLLSSKEPPRPTSTAIEHIPIAPLRNRDEYGHFILTQLARYVETEFALIVQWDGFVVDPDAWQPAFLNYDYIGAPWINFPSPFNVGNGGFSLRSRRLLEAGSAPWFEVTHPEDLSICHVNRKALEIRGLRIADETTASRFAKERGQFSEPHFGIHGAFALAEMMEVAEFDAFLSHVESHVMGKRELSDIIQIIARKRPKNSAVLRRCFFELISRHPFDWRSWKMLTYLR